MSDKSKKKIWKVRTVKNYPDAHNHVLIGEVVELTKMYVRLACRTFHFSKAINGIKDVRSGGFGVRILPWTRIELINELPANFDFSSADLVSTKDGKIALSDGVTDCILSSSYDNRF